MGERWYVVVNVGCIECGVSSNVVLLTRDKARADAEADRCGSLFDWRQGGQNSFEVFEVEPEVLAAEYEPSPAVGDGHGADLGTTEPRR